MAELQLQKLTVIGLGLITGSLVAALKARGFQGEIVATGRRAASLEQGQALGYIDSWTLDLADAVKGADIVVIGTPTQVAEDTLRSLQPLWRDDMAVTDVASVKGNLQRCAQDVFGRHPANLVLGHPIAGSEQSGVAAARADLFVDHRVIITPQPDNDPAAVDLVSALWTFVGAEVVSMPVDMHDRVLAATSHLPHLLAYGLVDALSRDVSAADIFRFSAGGFRDFTRIASSDPKMWHDIVLANRDEVLRALDQFTDNLSELRTAIVDNDSDGLMATFANAKDARDAYLQKYLEMQQRSAAAADTLGIE